MKGLNLRDCPFCGHPAEYDSQRHKVISSPRSPRFHDTLGHAVYCSSCPAETGIHDTQEEAIAAWNRRA